MTGTYEQPHAPEPAKVDDLLTRIGQLTRMLRDSMLELGLDKDIMKATESIPDARDRLSYVASMTEQAAERALNAIDKAKPLQDELEAGAQALDQRWDEWFANPIELEQARDLVEQTRSYLRSVPQKTQATNAELLDIMMAQDFQDLTGQVIKKMMDVIREIEHQLVQVLLDSVQEDVKDGDKIRAQLAQKNTVSKTQQEPSLLNGPQVNKEASDVVSGQDQVDALLDDLGF